jgi:hypothetical protein
MAVHTKSQRRTLGFGHFVCQELLSQQLERDWLFIQKYSVRRWVLDIRIFAGSSVLIGLLLLSFDSNLRRQLPAIAPAPVDSQQRIIGPQQLSRVVFYMTKTVAESGVRIGLIVLSFECKIASPMSIYISRTLSFSRKYRPTTGACENGLQNVSMLR